MGYGDVRISLEACRVNAHMKQKEWAEKLGVAPSTISNWENGTSEPNLSTLRKISELSGIPMDFIFMQIKS
ncbi:helix-turn-helix transcriptional regulator [Butyribacter intestini]|jgi:DNA-binding XRE family transcriptional regulator|uniref:helix-turn-helix transcriptional regulator n=1 Tax=Butyribacter intestini TaxID=1703332 RepID=UPI0022DFD455|nr:helix-turn-helix transcriptional regulator [Butyribacter intestini]